MVRKLMGLCIAGCFALVVVTAGCAENEHKVTEKKEIKTEGEVQDVSPGEMIVE